MAKLKVYRDTVKIPISVTWFQELVDDGAGGENFYMRLTPHVNLGGKSGVPRLTTYKGGLGKAFWQETKLDNAIIKAKIKRLMEKIEKDAIEEQKKLASQSVTKGSQMPRQQQPTKASNVGDTHAQALERTRRQHGISDADQAEGEAERKRQEQGGASQAQTAEDLMKTGKYTEEDLEIMRQMTGKSNAGYNAIVEDLNKTKVGYDDDDDYYL